MTINAPAVNKNAELLGDRDLAVWVGAGDGGIYTFATYTYTDLNGNGNPNVYQSVKHGEEIKDWHFIYFGYSHKERRAVGYVDFKTRKERVVFENVNHYLAK